MWRVLVVDGLTLFKDEAERRGMEWHTNAASALQAILSDDEPIDLVFLDVLGVESGGVDAHTIAELCAGRGVKVVMTTSSPMDAAYFRLRYGCFIGEKKDILKGPGAWRNPERQLRGDR